LLAQQGTAQDSQKTCFAEKRIHFLFKEIAFYDLARLMHGVFDCQRDIQLSVETLKDMAYIANSRIRIQNNLDTRRSFQNVELICVGAYRSACTCS
jgi:hypothetical protein